MNQDERRTEFGLGRDSVGWRLTKPVMLVALVLAFVVGLAIGVQLHAAPSALLGLRHAKTFVSGHLIPR